jgi:hypothetical protein
MKKKQIHDYNYMEGNSAPLPLGRSRSKDHISIKNNLREKYMNVGGA